MLTTRDIEPVAVSERKALLKYTGLRDHELVNVRLERESFPQIDLAHWDGIILCGSSYDVSEDEDTKSLKQKHIEHNLGRLSEEVIKRDFPFFGICYGLGIMARMLGGKVGPEISEDMSAPTLTLTPEGSQDPILQGIPAQFRAYVGHHESVVVPPSEITALVTGEIAPLQMARIGHNIYLTQFHPELDYEGMQVRVESFADHGYFQPHERADVEKRIAGVDTSPGHQILRNFVNRFGDSRGVA